MNIKGRSRKCAGWFAWHLAKTEQGQQLVRLIEVRGLGRAKGGIQDNLAWGLSQMEAVSLGTKCDNFFYHASINPRAHEELDEQQWEQAVDLLEEKLGLTGQPRLVVEHTKEGRTHRHCLWQRVDPETMTAISDSRTYPIHQRVADELERRFGHEPTPRGTRLDRRNPKDYEVFRGKQTKIPVKQVEAEVGDLWRQADSPHAFAAALEEHGYILCIGDRGLLVVDQAAKEHSLYKRLGLHKKDLDARMAGVDRSALPSVEEARKLAREHMAHRRKDAPDAPLPDFAPDPEPGTKGPGGAQRELPAPERPDREHHTRQCPEHVSAPSPAPLSNLSAFERVVAQWKDAYREAVGDGSFIAEGIDWLARKLGTRQAAPTSPGRALTPFEQVAEDTKQAFAENGGEPPTIGTTSFWQRAVAMLQEVGGHAMTLVKNVKDQVTGFVGRLLHDRSPDREHEPELER